MRSKLPLLVVICLLLIPFSYAAEEYKPYLHKATVPDHPEVRLFGQYRTNLFPGAATYSYPIEVPKGTNGLQPSLAVSYNSQSVQQRSSTLGSGWFLAKDYVYRDINSTTDDSTDDKFLLVLDGNLYELVYDLSEGFYHTEVEYHFKIENLSSAGNTYWQVTKKDGTKYRMGYNSDSRLDSNTGQSYDIKWHLDEVEDTPGNKIYYSYLEDPNAEDTGAVYLDKIEYNNDQSRKVEFTYESSVRPDRRLIYDQGNKLEESRRLTDISVYSDSSSLVRRYHLDYTTLNPALSSLSKLTYHGSDNASIWYNISFNYHTSEEGYSKDTSIWKPPVLFGNDAHDDYGARLVDVNNDGFMDIVQRKGGGDNKAWVNDKVSNWTEDSSWTVPVDIVTSANADEGVRFADVNRDGFTDLIKSKSGTRSVYINNGTDWASSSWTFPIDIVDSSGNDLGVRLADVNADGRVDIIKAKSTKTVYLNTGSGWNSSSWTFPEDFVDGSYKDQGLRLVDLNGDGLIDTIKGNDGTRSAWLNNGEGWVTNSTWTPSVDFTTASRPDNGVRFADVNGDGLVDMLQDFFNDTPDKGAWINTGNGWSSNSSWQSPEAFTKDGYNIGRRLADVNGDGFADIIVSHQDSSTQYSWIKNSTLPYMIKSINNEYGGTTTINYTTSTQYNNSEDGISDIGFNIFVVSNIVANNSLGAGLSNASRDLFSVISLTNYSYSLGKYNYNKSEFRGFGISTEQDPSKITKHYFYQDDPRRGKEYQTEIYDLNGNIYTKNLKDYNWTQDGEIYNISLIYSTNYLYDGNPTNPKITNKSYQYDFYENLESVTDFGDVSISGDEKYTNYTYAIHTANWILDKPASVTIYDSTGNRITDTKYYYDELGLRGMGTKGELTKVERWNSDGNNSYTYYEYDSFGNILTETDSLGYSTKYSYDTTHTYPDSMTNPIGHITYYNYAPGTGNLNWQEHNDIRTSYVYDTFSRILKEVQPYDTNTSPTKSYIYSFDGFAPESIKMSFKTTANNSNDIYYLYDGFANIAQIKTDIEDNKQIIKNLFYDDNLRVSSEQNPYFAQALPPPEPPSSSPFPSDLTNISNVANYTYYTYDPLDRVTTVLNSDGTTKTVTFNRYNITDFDENGNKHMYLLDAHGRITSVYEYNTNDVGINETYTTTYEYDQNDNLLEITDHPGNQFQFTYDSLNRKTAMSDPDLGEWSYLYDKNGNLISQTDARGEAITLTYDALGRISHKTYSHNGTTYNITFSYDQDYYGTLTDITFNTSMIYSYEYDDRLRITKETKNYGNGANLAFDYVYDSQNRRLSKEWGGNDRDYIFNKQGQVSKIPNILTQASYSPFGSMLNRTYANNLIQTYTYDSETNRLTAINLPSVQNLTYTYDNIGNILTINDQINSRLHTLSYDNLDRLTHAQIGPDIYKYSFNPTGNMMKIVKNNESKKFVYNGNQAHAPSKIIEGQAGIDVYNPIELSTGNKNRTFEFFLANDKSTSISDVNLTVNFGDGNSFTNNSLTVNDNLMIFVQNNYSQGGDYSINVSASSPGINDEQTQSTKFGARAQSLTRLNSNISNHIFEFVVHNDISETVQNVTWNCSDGINSIYPANLTTNQSLYDYIQHSYATPGRKTFSCTVTSNDGSETQTLDFTVKGLEIENYDILTTETSKRVISYDVKNYFADVETNISMSGEGIDASQLTNLSSDENIMVFTEINYSSDGTKTLEVEASTSSNNTNYSSKHIETFKTEGVSIENYDRTTSDYTTNIISFDLRNNWNNGSVNWSLSEPGITNATHLNNNETLMVFVENNQTEQGNSRAEVTAQVSSFIDTLKNAFEIRPLKILSLLTLSEGTNAVSELVVKNNLNQTQQFNWLFNTGTEDVSSSLINISSNDLFVYIESNYSSSGVYGTKATVNSTTYNDTQSGVIVS